MKKIPKEFYLFGQKITVVIDNKRCDLLEALGVTHNETNEIILADNYKGSKLPEDSILQTFYHELTHHILFKMNEFDLGHNEKFVQTFSSLLHQYEVTKVISEENSDEVLKSSTSLIGSI